MSLHTRQGKFILYDVFSNDEYLKIIENIFSIGIIITDIKRDYESRTITYLGISKNFVEIEEDDEVPYYNLVTDINDKNNSWYIIDSVKGIPCASANLVILDHCKEIDIPLK